MSRPKLPRVARICARPGCDQTFEVRENAADASRQYCSRQCARQVENQARSGQKRQEWDNSPESLCPCGQERIPYEVRHTTKYCSVECRSTYGKKRQPDPDKQITFSCGTCGKEVTRWVGYGSTVSGKRFCDRYCAARYTRTVKHHVLREMDMVLDSGWEVLLVGLCHWHKVEVSRVSRSLAVEVDGSAYAPDLLVGDTWVEVKGHVNGAQRKGWAAWREQVGPLVIVDRTLLNRLRLSPGRNDFLGVLASD